MARANEGLGRFRLGSSVGVDGGLDVTQGNKWYVDPANGSNGNSGSYEDEAFSTLEAAESAAVANQNDIVYYLAGSSSLSLSAALTWDKDYTHLIGVGAPASAANRARIFSPASVDAAVAMTISAKGCIFSNFYLFQGGDAATSLGCIKVTGGRNYFENVHIAGPGHATPAGETGAYALELNGGEENKFVDCTIGLDTIKRTADNAIIRLDTSATRNEFQRCKVISHCETNTVPMVKLVDTNAADRYTLFQDTLFYNFWANHADKLLEVFEVPGAAATHDIILMRCLAIGADEWEANDRGQIWVENLGGAATSGIGLAPAL